MATVNKDFIVKNGVVAGANVQGVQLVSTTSSLPPFTVTSSANVANLSADLLDGLHSSYFLDWENTTNKPDPTISFYLAGALTGSGTVTLNDLGSASLVIYDSSVALDGVTLGIETFGDYVESLQAGTGVTVSHSSGESASPTISIGQDVSLGASVTFANITLSQTLGAPIVVSSSALISNLNSNYLNGYTVEQLIGMAGVQSVTGTSNEITVSASTGNVQVGLPDNVTIAGSLTIGENLIVTGSTVVVNSTVVTIDDPVFTLGGDTDGLDDNKDRGIEFKWNNGSPKVGFFGFNDSSGKFTFIPDATNTSEVFSGTKGTIDANIEWADVLSKPDPSLTLLGDVSGNATFTDLGSASLTVTVEKDFNLVFGGDVTGTGTVSNLDSASIALTIAANSVALGSDTTGDYVANIFGTADQVLVAGNGGETASVVLSLPQSIATTSTPTFAGVNVSNGSLTSSSATLTVNSTETTIDTFAVSSITTAEYFVQAKQGTKMTATKVTVMWDGTDVLVSEYSIIDSAAGAANLTFTASESGGTVSFTASSPDAASTNIAVKVVRTAINA
jgi:hypothetical protein